MKTRNANKRSSLPGVSPESDESPEKIRRILPRQKGKGEKTKLIRNDRCSLRSVSPESDNSAENIRSLSPRQKRIGGKTKSITNDRSSLLAVSPESEKSPENIRRVSPKQKQRGGKTKSITNDRSSLHSVSPESDESRERVKGVSRRQKGGRRKAERIKHDNTSSSDKGYGGSSCEDNTDWQRRDGRSAADSRVLAARKRKSEDAHDESSDSSSDDFLVPTQSLDFNSDFFKIEKKEIVSDFSGVESSIFAGINRLSESDESDDLQGSKPAKIEKVAGKLRLQKGKQIVKDELCSVGLVTIKVEDVSNVKMCPVRRGKKTFNAKQQKSSVEDSRQRNSHKNIVKPSFIEAEKEASVQNDKTQDIGRKQLHKVKVETSAPDVSKLEVSQLLALGEGLDRKAEPKPVGKTKRRNVSKKHVDSEDDGISDWEEVDISISDGQQFEHSIPEEGIAVTVQIPNMHQKKKKKGFDVMAYIKRRMNRVRRDIQVLMHKAHLLCWIAHGNYVNKILNSEILMGLSLSLIPPNLFYPDKCTDLVYLQQIVQWFSKNVEVQENVDNEEDLLVSLEAQFQKKTAKSRRDMVLMFVCVLRSLGINTRLVISLQPLPLKPPLLISTSKGKKVKERQQKKTHSGRKKDYTDTSEAAIWKSQDVVTKEEVVSCIAESTAKEVDKAGKSNQKESSNNLVATKKINMPESASATVRSLRARKSARKYVDDGGTTDSDDEMVQQEKECVKKPVMVNRNSTTSKRKISISENISVKDTNRCEVRNSCSIAPFSNTESNYTADIKVNKYGKGKPDRRVLSSDSESDDAPVAETTRKKQDRCDVWSEVFLESEEKWICVDVYHRQIHCAQELSSRASRPVHYILAWQDDSTIRDVTRRYCPKWHNVTRKLRVDEEWWRESLKPFTGQRTARDDKEDEDLYHQLRDRPMPSSLAEYKNHPLYALKKDLLKFQAIYPPDAPTLGFVRGHPVYARECVHTLHSREKWLREAKVVRLGETPYKIVKARPKWDRISGKVIKDIPLEIFGPWQVEDYVPPTAVDGKVPRCAYGNVELFKPSMLPGGTVHMQIPGLNRVARKLQIDCAPAIIGFGYNNGIWGPVYDGFVVCEEYKYVLAEAWQAEEEEADRRHEEKRLKRIYGNWRRLIKGLFIRERLKARYNFGPVKETTSTKTKKAKRFLESKRIKCVYSDDSDWEMGQCD